MHDARRSTRRALVLRTLVLPSVWEGKSQFYYFNAPIHRTILYRNLAFLPLLPIVLTRIDQFVSSVRTNVEADVLMRRHRNQDRGSDSIAGNILIGMFQT